MRKLAFGIVLVAVCLIAREGAGLPAFANLAPGSNCYPHNLFSYTAGPAFNASTKGQAYFDNAEIEIPGHVPYSVETTYGGTMSWRLVERMSKDSGSYGDPQDGTIGGYLLVDIRWENHTRTTFVSRCMAEVQTEYHYDSDVGDQVKQIELEAEGQMQGFPGLPAGTHDAVASIVVARNQDTGDIAVAQLGLELGSTCNEGDPETEIGLKNSESVDPTGTLTAPASTAGAMGFPGGHDKNNCSGFN